MDAAEYPHSAWDLRRSMQGHPAQARRRSVRAVQLVVPIAMVLRRQERRQIASHRTQLGAAQPSHDQTRRGNSLHRPNWRTLRRTRLRRYARLVLYVGYDERGLAETSCDLTTFQSPFGTLC